ncbi:hypothetical protein [Agromyces sp. S2-1-8]|uniref:hypothetical protein n=1 Tax=Agromyces sp. S2-1-8 TaxID=2897180 RepID=UPI001E3341B3|nr:hypothetical protein [Agromyces sp. S2-1-8]MCD5348415.1 hypothetical protein [Agromyces sp. S2-1-8]
MTVHPDEHYTSYVLRLEAELPAGAEARALEWWSAAFDEVTNDLSEDQEVGKATVARVRFVRVHGLIWGPAIIETLDEESQEHYEVGEALFAGLDEDEFEDLRELRSSLAIVESIEATEPEHGAAAMRALGRTLDDSMFVLAPGMLPWVEAGGEPIDDELRIRRLTKAYLRGGFAPHRASSELMILAHAEHLARLEHEQHSS